MQNGDGKVLGSDANIILIIETGSAFHIGITTCVSTGPAATFVIILVVQDRYSCAIAGGRTRL